MVGGFKVGLGGETRQEKGLGASAERGCSLVDGGRLLEGGWVRALMGFCALPDHVPNGDRQQQRANLVENVVFKHFSHSKLWPAIPRA